VGSEQFCAVPNSLRYNGSAMTRFLIVPDSFKGSLSAMEVACHIAGGIRSMDPEASIRVMPMADGGEGTIEAVEHALGGNKVDVEVRGPLGVPVTAPYLVLDDRTVIIEMAQASGLPLVSRERRDPLRTTTLGVGELIRHAVLAGAKRVWVGPGHPVPRQVGASSASGRGGPVRPVLGRHPSVAGRFHFESRGPCSL
jgi:glycerate kinase